jgi:hypothetical protein
MGRVDGTLGRGVLGADPVDSTQHRMGRLTQPAHRLPIPTVPLTLGCLWSWLVGDGRLSSHRPTPTFLESCPALVGCIGARLALMGPHRRVLRLMHAFGKSLRDQEGLGFRRDRSTSAEDARRAASRYPVRYWLVRRRY